MKRIAAALTLLTRLPVWKWCDIPAAAYSDVVVFWPLTGWLTGGITALSIYILSMIMPVLPAVVSAMVVRLLFTGALHEDGLADFCDGFGGGRDKESILAIMKDSHIGTYGVIGLISYFLLMAGLLSSLHPSVAALAVFAADPFSKTCASQLVNRLRYARPEGAKNKVSYSKMNIGQFFANVIFGILPVFPLIVFAPELLCSLVFPIFCAAAMISRLKKRIGGYTGDCCGATYLVCELAMCFGIVMIYGICVLS